MVLGLLLSDDVPDAGVQEHVLVQRRGHETAASRQLEGHTVDIHSSLRFHLVQQAIQGDQRPHLAHATTAVQQERTGSLSVGHAPCDSSEELHQALDIWLLLAAPERV